MFQSLVIVASLLIGVPAMAAPVVRDADLDRLIETSMVSSPLLYARQNDLKAAGSDVDAARWQYFPTLSADLQQGSSASNLNARIVRVEQRLYTGGRLDADLRGAQARRDSTALGIGENALALALQIVDTYTRVETANAQRRNIERYQSSLAALNESLARRIESGVSAAADRSLISARIAQSENELSAARSSVRTGTLALKRLVAAPEVVDRVLAARTGELGPLTAEPIRACDGTPAAEAAWQETLLRHPTMLRIDKDVEAARATADAQRAALSPVVGVRVEQPISPSSDSALRSTRVSLFVQYSSDAGLSALARSEGASARVASLLDQRDAARRELDEQLRAECVQWSGLRERLGGLERAKTFTSDVVESSRRLFVAGRRSWLDLLNAAREDFDNRQNELATLAALNGSTYRLALLTAEYALAVPNATALPPTAASGQKAWFR